MPNPENAFLKSFIQKCRGVIREATAADAISHPSVKGTVRELLAARLLQPVLPPDVRIGSGQLTSREGTLSPQLDVILYGPTILPPVLFDERTGLFPVESCLYAVEVKSRLTSSNLSSTIANAKAVSGLTLLGTQHIRPADTETGPLKIVAGPTVHPVNALFAFASDLSGDPLDEIARYRRLDPKADTDPAVQAICICGRGYWYSLPHGGWNYVAANADIREVLSFLGGLTNTLPQLLVAKGRPRFGLYLLDAEPMQKV